MQDNLAERMWSARDGGTVIEVAPQDRPGDDAAAYGLQAAVSRIAGTDIVGWKVGATAQAAMDMLGLSEPFFGPLYAQHFYDGAAEVPIVPAHGAALETEFVVGLAADLPYRDAGYSAADVAAAVAWVAPGFEIIGTRIAGGLAGAGRMAIADGGANMCFLLGSPVTEWRSLDLSCHPTTLYLNGRSVATGHSGMLLFGNTLGSVAWLASHWALAERGLEAGDVITTGTCTGITPIAVGDRARADFAQMGELRVSFVGGNGR